MFVLFVMQSYLIEVRGLKPSERDFTADPEKMQSYLIEVRGLKRKRKAGELERLAGRIL